MQKESRLCGGVKVFWGLLSVNDDRRSRMSLPTQSTTSRRRTKSKSRGGFLWLMVTFHLELPPNKHKPDCVIEDDHVYVRSKSSPQARVFVILTTTL
jgi:hypothetical protein